MPDEQGRTRYQVLTQFAERTGRRHPDLDVPPPHPAVAYVLSWWRELHMRRRDTYTPLSHAEIAAWASLTRRAPTLEELDALRRMDDVVLSVHAEAAQKRADANAAKARKGRG